MHPSIKHQIRTRYMMVLHHFTQNNTETAVVCIKFFNFHLKKIQIIEYIYLQVPTTGTLFYFLFSIFASCKTDTTICLPIIKRTTDTYIV